VSSVRLSRLAIFPQLFRPTRPPSLDAPRRPRQKIINNLQFKLLSDTAKSSPPERTFALASDLFYSIIDPVQSVATWIWKA